MTRLACVAAVALATAALAGPRERAAEANQVMNAFADGAMSVQQAANRIDFLGANVVATAQLSDMLRKRMDPSREGEALELLASITVPDEEAELVLTRALGRDDVSMRRTGARGLGRMNTATAVKALGKALSDKASGVRREAATSLGKIGNAAGGKALVAAAKLEDDPEVRAVMLLAVGQCGDTKQVKPLKTFLSSSSESTRLAASRALCLLGAKEGFAFAKERLESPQASERLQAVLLFEGGASKRISKALKPMLKDTDPHVRATAARVMAQGGDRKMLEWLVVESAKLTGDERLPYEEELERLRLTSEERSRILKHAGLK